jgi:hypothetical protein
MCTREQLALCRKYIEELVCNKIFTNMQRCDREYYIKKNYPISYNFNNMVIYELLIVLNNINSITTAITDDELCLAYNIVEAQIHRRDNIILNDNIPNNKVNIEEYVYAGINKIRENHLVNFYVRWDDMFRKYVVEYYIKDDSDETREVIESFIMDCMNIYDEQYPIFEERFDEKYDDF